MPRLAANLTMMFNEVEFLDRFALAAGVGFRGVEALFPYAWPCAEIKARLDDCGLEMVLINTPPGDWEAGERGLAAIPGGEDRFRAAFEMALDYAEGLAVPQIHIMAGQVPDATEFAAAEAVFCENLAWAAARTPGLRFLIEPLNHFDVPGYLLSRNAQAARLIAEIGAKNLFLQYDFYHAQLMDGNLTRGLVEWLPIIRHVQFSGVPERHEPDAGQEINYPYFFDLLDDEGYDGWMACEYHPRVTTLEGLDWAKPFGISTLPSDRV